MHFRTLIALCLLSLLPSLPSLSSAPAPVRKHEKHARPHIKCGLYRVSIGVNNWYFELSHTGLTRARHDYEKEWSYFGTWKFDGRKLTVTHRYWLDTVYDYTVVAFTLNARLKGRDREGYEVIMEFLADEE